MSPSRWIVVALAISATSVSAFASDWEEVALHQAELSIGGDDFGCGADTLWAMSGPWLMRVDQRDNTVTNYWIKGASGSLRRILVQEDAVWVPDVGSQKVYR